MEDVYSQGRALFEQAMFTHDARVHHCASYPTLAAAARRCGVHVLMQSHNAALYIRIRRRFQNVGMWGSLDFLKFAPASLDQTISPEDNIPRGLVITLTPGPSRDQLPSAGMENV